MVEPAERPPILRDKHWQEASAFTPESLLREARRQKQASTSPVPEVCILDPDGDIVRSKRAQGLTRPHRDWVCYHTELDVISLGGREVGIVGCAVGSAFAVLVAEELFVCGCRLILSLTSAGQLTPVEKPPYFILIDRALRDEGTSYHYCPPSDYSHAPAELVSAFEKDPGGLPAPVITGQAGPRMPLFGRRKARLSVTVNAVCWRSRWRRRRCMRLHRPAVVRSCASPM